MKIYLLPGYAYDCRIFDKLDFKDYTVERLSWIDPKPKEGFTDYALRLFGENTTDKEPIILIGHSMGGMIAQEIATIKPIRKIILLSSIQSRKELPLYFKMVKPLGIHQFISKNLILNSFKYWGKNHGFEIPEEKKLFKSMVEKHSNNYLKWALKNLSTWKTPALSKKTVVFHIHGTKDKTFPFKLIKNPAIVIENGGHMLCYKRACEINDILLEELAKV